MKLPNLEDIGEAVFSLFLLTIGVMAIIATIKLTYLIIIH